MNDNAQNDPRLHAIPDIHGHAKGEHKAFADERPIPLSARMLFLWFYHACRRGWPRFMMVTDHMNYLTFEDPAAINLVRRALKLAHAGDLYGAAETASVEVGHAAVVSEGLRRGMRYSIGAEVDNDPRSRPDAQNIVDAMKPDGMIRSVHFLTIDHPTHGPNWNWPFDNPEFVDVYELIGTTKTWELYMAALLDAIERLPGNIVGHFYAPALFGHWPDDETLEGYENALVEACEARGMAIEFNTRFLYRDHSDDERARYLGAHRRLLAKCKAKNVGIAVGSDAHSPKDQGGAFAIILALLDESEINELVFPIGGRLARVALRVERKVEPVPEPAGPPAEERRTSRKARPETAPELPSPVAADVDDAAADARKIKARPKRTRPKAADVDAAAETFVAGSVAESATAGPDEAIAPQAKPAAGQPEYVHSGPNGRRAPGAPDPVAAAGAVPAYSAEAATSAVAEPLALDGQPEPAGVTPSPTASQTVAGLTHSAAGESATGPVAVAPAPAIARPKRSTPKRKPVKEHAVAIEPTPAAPAIDIPLTEPVERDAIEELVTTAEFEPIVTAEAEAEPAALGFTAGEHRVDSREPEAQAVVITFEPDGAAPLAVEPDLQPPAHVPERAAAPRAATLPPRKLRPKAVAVKPKAAAVKPKAAVKAKPASARTKKVKPLAKASAPGKKAAVKKAPAKKAVPSAAAKKASAKKATAKKAPAKKAAVRPTGTKKSTAKKSSAKKASPKKPAQRRR